MHVLPRAKPPTQALGCLALHTRGLSTSPWTCSTHAPLSPPSPTGSPCGRGTPTSGCCASHAAASVACTSRSTASAYQEAASSAVHSTGATPGVRCWAVCGGPTAPLSLPTGARSAASGRRAACPGAAAGPLSSAWPCRCVPGPRLRPSCSEPAEWRTERHLTPGAEARGGGGSVSGSFVGASRTGGGSTGTGSALLASIAASAAAASVGSSRALAGVAVLRAAAVQLRPVPSSAPYLRAPARLSPSAPARPATPLAGALPAAASAAGGGTGSSAASSPSSGKSGSGGSSSSSRRSPLVFVGSGRSSSAPSGRAVAAAGSTQMAAAESRIEAEVAAAQAPGVASSSWPPPAERLEAVAARLRAQPRVQHKPVSDRAAAVLVGLFEDSSGVVRVLLTQRSSRLKSHRGEVCLPGGKRDEEDVDDAATALREANEELGLDPSAATVLCCLPPVLSKHHLSVTPVLALLAPEAVPAPHPAEVDAAFTVPLAVFLGTYADPRRDAATAAGAAAGAVGGSGAGGVEQQAGSSSAPAPADDGTDGSGRRTRRRRSAAAAPPADAEPKPLSWRPPAAAASKAAAAAAAAAAGAGGEGGVGCVRPIGSDCVYGNAVHEYRDISWGEHEYRIHSFQYGDFDVWGLTATICIAAARLALGREPSFQERCPGGQHYSCFYWDGSALRVRPEAEIAHTGSAAAIVSAAPEAATAAEAGPAAAVAAGRGDGGRAPGEGGVMQLPSREDLAAAADVAVEAVEEEVVIAAAGTAGAL